MKIYGMFILTSYICCLLYTLQWSIPGLHQRFPKVCRASDRQRKQFLERYIWPCMAIYECMDHIWPCRDHICPYVDIYGPIYGHLVCLYMATCDHMWLYMSIYGRYMAIYDCVWTKYGHLLQYMSIHEPCMIHHLLTAGSERCQDGLSQTLDLCERRKQLYNIPILA